MTQQAHAGPIAEVGLEYFGSYRVRLKPPVDFGVGPYGNRMLFEGIDGDFAGEGLRGRFINGGGDWLLVGPDGFARLDVRIQLQTEDGANIYITYFGVIEMTERFQQALSGTSKADAIKQACIAFGQLSSDVGRWPCDRNFGEHLVSN